MSVYTLPCVLFAGGKSSRMGEDKAFLPFGEHDSLIQYQVQRLKEVFEHVYISAKDAKKFNFTKTAVIEDLDYNNISAPSVGFLNVFNTLKDSDAFFVLSVDAPFVNKNVIDRLLEVKTDQFDAIIIRTPSGIHPLCGIYTRSLLKPIKAMLEKSEYKLMHLLKKSKVCYIDIEDEMLLSNLNTPQEYQKALKTLYS